MYHITHYRNSTFESVSHFCGRNTDAASDVEFPSNLIRSIEFAMAEMRLMSRAFASVLEF